MDGIPDKVSDIKRTTLTSLFPLFAYSVMYTAEKIPIGTAISSVTTMVISVFIKAGTTDAFSLVYFASNICGVIFGIPRYRIYTTIAINTPTVRIAAIFTISRISSESL